MQWFAGLEEIVAFDEPLARHTSFAIGGPAACFATPRTGEEVVRLLETCRSRGVEWRVLGAGTNVLASDEGFDGVVIHLSRAGFGALHRDAHGARCGGALPLPRLVRIACREWRAPAYAALAGIPGEVAGAVRMNAGGQHGAIGALVRSVLVAAPERGVQRLPRMALTFGYRTSTLTDVVMLEAELAVGAPDPEAPARFEAILAEKQRTQPWRERSAGCVFANPSGVAGSKQSAGWLIDHAGLKGCAVGDAVVSHVHANFIVNRGRATAADVRALIETIRERVHAVHDTELALEIETW